LQAVAGSRGFGKHRSEQAPVHDSAVTKVKFLRFASASTSAARRTMASSILVNSISTGVLAA
jgi:hypothetical protein